MMNEKMKEIKLWYQPVHPSSVLHKVLDTILDSGIDALVLETYCSGTIPTLGEYSLIPVIQKATALEIPVFMISGATDGLRYTEWSDYTEEWLPGTYEPEREAIAAGATPLGTDTTQSHEVIQAIKEIFKEHTDYAGRIKAVSERFSSPAWLQRLEEIKKDPLFEKYKDENGRNNKNQI